MSPIGEKSLSVYKLVGLTGQRRVYVEKHLKLLVKHGWVKEVPVAGFKNYALNHDNPKVAHLVEFFKKIR